MNNGLGFQLANVPTITGLASIQANDVTTDVINATTITVDGVDITTILNDKVSKTLANTATGINTFNNVSNVWYGDGSHLTGIPVPTNMVTTDTTQTITGAKTMNSVSNVFYGDGANLTGIPVPTNMVTTNTTQTITGAKTMNNVSNVFYGDGSNLTGVVAGAPTTMTVTNNNSATTFYPIFASSGGGAQSLLYDTTVTPLSYQPSTSALTCSQYRLENIGIFSVDVATNTVFFTSAIAGGSIQFVVTTALGLAISVFLFNETDVLFNAMVTLKSPYVGATTLPTFNIKDYAVGQGIKMISNASAGAQNPLTVLNDTCIHSYGASISTKSLTLTTNSATTSGVRINPTSVMVGAGGTTATPSNYMLFNGTGITINGPITYTGGGTSNTMTTDTDQIVTGQKTIQCGATNYLKIDHAGSGGLSATTNTNILQSKTSFQITNKSQTTATGTMFCRTLAGNSFILIQRTYSPGDDILTVGDVLTCASFTTNNDLNMQIASIKKYTVNLTTTITSTTVTAGTGFSLTLGSNIDWSINGLFAVGTYVVSGTGPNYVMSSPALASQSLVPTDFFTVYTNQTITATLSTDTSITYTRKASINLSCSSLASTNGVDNNTVSISDTECQINGNLILTRPTYTSPSGNGFQNVLNGCYPIGYCVQYSQTTLAFTSGTSTFVSSGITLAAGVWLISSYQRITRGTGTTNTASVTVLQLGLVSGTGTFSPNVAQSVPMVAGNTYTIWDYSFGNTTYVATTASVIGHTQITVMTVGTATRKCDLIFTKIA